MTGASIEGQGTLTNVYALGNEGDACISESTIISSVSGSPLSYEVVDCTVLVIEGGASFCENAYACNDGEIGACEFPEENFDCDGNCSAEVD